MVKETREEKSKAIDKNRKDYFEFVGFESHESFRLMVEFLENVNANLMQNKLLTALKKPNLSETLNGN